MKRCLSLITQPRVLPCKHSVFTDHCHRARVRVRVGGSALGARTKPPSRFTIIRRCDHPPVSRSKCRRLTDRPIRSCRGRAVRYLGGRKQGSSLCPNPNTDPNPQPKRAKTSHTRGCAAFASKQEISQLRTTIPKCKPRYYGGP